MKKPSHYSVITSKRIPFKAFYQSPEPFNFTEDQHLSGEQFIESEKYKALFDTISDVIVETDLYGSIININPACLDFFGYSPEQMQGHSLQTFYVDPESFKEMLKLVSLSNQVLKFHAKLKTNNDSFKTAAINARSIYDINGTRTGIDIFIKDNTDKQKAEEEIIRAKDFYETILNALSADIAVFDMDYKYRFLNQNAVKDTETRNWLLNKTDFEYCERKGISKSMAEGRLKNYEHVRITGKPVEWLEELKNKGGDTTYIHRVLEAFEGQDGKPFIIGSGFDVTQLEKTKQLLTKSEGYVRSLLQSLPDLILRVSKEGKLLDFTLNDADELAILPGMITGKSLKESWPLEIADLHLKSARQTLRHGKVVTYEFPMQMQNGNVRFFESRANRINENEVVIIARDITEKKLNEERVEKRERQLNEAQQIAKIGSYEFDPKTGIVLCSDEIYNILESSRESYNKGSVEEFFTHVHPSDFQRALKSKDKFSGDAQSFSNEFKIISGTGKEKYIYAKQTPIMDDEGNIKLVVGTIQDITEQKEFEKKLFYAVIESEEKERDRIAAELHDGVCQDLTVAKLTIELAEGMINEDHPKLKEMVTRSRDIILHSLNMTRRVSHQLMPKELFDRHFCDIVTEMINQLNQVDNINYELNIRGNRKEMDQFVTINLYRIIQEFIRNSQKHSSTKKLSIDIDFTEEKLSISCKDHGQGFDMKKTSNKGIGLLNIGKRIDGIGGSFRLMSRPGEGVELSISYPV